MSPLEERSMFGAIVFHGDRAPEIVASFDFIEDAESYAHAHPDASLFADNPVEEAQLEELQGRLMRCREHYVLGHIEDCDEVTARWAKITARYA